MIFNFRKIKKAKNSDIMDIFTTNGIFTGNRKEEELQKREEDLRLKDRELQDSLIGFSKFLQVYFFSHFAK